MKSGNSNPRNTDEQLAKNEKEWIAWQEWKWVCSVLGCSPVNRKCLSKVVFNAFKKKLSIVSSVLYDQWKNTLSLKCQEFIQEFDTGIELKKNEGLHAALRQAKGELPRREETLTTASPSSKTNVRVSPKDYKSRAFNLAMQQPDDPLRAIRGQLIGPLGIINAIVEHYLLYVCGLSLDWIYDDETGKRSIGFAAKSLDEMAEHGRENPDQDNPSNEPGHLTGFNNLSEEGEADPVDTPDPLDIFVNPDSEETDETVLAEFRDELRTLYNPRQMAVLLAFLTGMPISSVALQKFYGARHSTLDKAFHSLVIMERDPATGKKVAGDIPGLSSLRNRYLERLNFQVGAVYQTIFTVFRETISMQPGGDAFLAAISAQT